MNELMEQNPLLLLFVVASIGYFIGNIRVKGISLGVAAVLFTGLVFGALNTDLTIPSIITNLGLQDLFREKNDQRISNIYNHTIQWIESKASGL